MLKKFLAERARYRNTYAHSNPSMRDFLRWLLTRTAPPKPVAQPLTRNSPEGLRANTDTPTLTWIGHSTFLIQIEGRNILTDPIFTDRASPVYFAGPKRITPPGLKLEQLPRIDIVLISHDHHDHLNAHSVRTILKRARDAGEAPPLFVVPSGLGHWFRKRGFPCVEEIGWWETLESSAAPQLGGLRIHGTPSQHWSQRFPWIVNRTHWSGFVVEGRGGKLFFPGDTGYSRDFADIRERLGAVTVALLPIGAYEPRWFMEPMHTSPYDAVRIHQDLNVAQSVAMHWGTFPLTDEPFDEPPRLLARARQEAGVPEGDFWVMGHGETRDLSHVWKKVEPAAPGPADNHIDADLGA
jgi:N-acyl-phosphatidylethanolamine-hydrolysing phospholipase D